MVAELLFWSPRAISKIPSDIAQQYINYFSQ